MYPSINTDEVLTTARYFFEANNKELQTDFPAGEILNCMVTALRNNIFHFGETYWIQKKGI